MKALSSAWIRFDFSEYSKSMARPRAGAVLDRHHATGESRCPRGLASQQFARLRHAHHVPHPREGSVLAHGARGLDDMSHHAPGERAADAAALGAGPGELR